MTRIEKVSIGKYAFNVDVDALKEIQDYLDDLERHYAGAESGKEILEEIENRLAELLMERCPAGVVADIENARAVMDILGRPEVIDEDNKASEGGVASDHKSEEPKRKLYRDVENRVFGGVCSGLANYFKFDLVAMRIIWVGLFILTASIDWLDNVAGAIILTYIILWLCIPAANTMQKRAQMRGRDLGIGSIQTERDYIADSRRGRGVARGIMIAFGILFVIIALAGASAVVLAHLGLTSGHYAFLSSALSEWVEFNGAAGTTSLTVTTVFLYIVTCLPWVGLLYLGIMLIFNIKEPRWRPGLIMFLIWLVAVFGFAVSAAHTFFMCNF